MGAPGSGDFYRCERKTTTDEVNRIDIRFMRKQGLLKPNTQGSLSWTCGGESSGYIHYTCYSHELRLHCRYRANDEGWQSVEQQIIIERTPCNYGGNRPWFFNCPRCQKRVAILYGADVLFLCRYCYQLPYTSQSRGYMDRLIEQKHKLGERIFEQYECGEGRGEKKGMHWSTFDRLHAKYQALETEWCMNVARRFSGFSDIDL